MILASLYRPNTIKPGDFVQVESGVDIVTIDERRLERGKGKRMCVSSPTPKVHIHLDI